MIKLDRLKDGKTYAVTFSYDDGNVADERLVKILNDHNLKGTFHLNSNRLNFDSSLYDGHEISCHGSIHASLSFLPVQNVHQEVWQNRVDLEKYSGYIVRGMSYAYGAYNDEMIDALKACGIVYSRTTKSTGSFGIPSDFMQWHPTCHHKNAEEATDKFLNLLTTRPHDMPRLLYIWGHSYEFNNDDNWDLIEKVADRLSGNDAIWYATNIEIYEYVQAAKSLVISADNSIVHNPSSQTVWFTNDGKEYSVGAGETIHVD